MNLQAAIFTTIALCTSTSAWAASKPNVVVILSDDQGWGDLSVNGNTNLSTPNIDSLARDGALFDRFFVCPVCSPTRAEFLTGRYHPRGGVWSTSTGGERLDLDEKTIGDSFKAAGYKVGAFGKWHNGTQYPYHPNARGFDEFYGFCSGHWGDYFNTPLEHNGQLVVGDGFIADDFTNHAIQFIESNQECPFFCYLPLNTPHSPMQVPGRFFEKFKDAKLEMRHVGPQKEDLDFTRAALAMCENIDWNVGRLLKRLDELKLANDTIVLYFCDNGPNGWRWNGGMKGRKGTTDEGGVRSPLLLRWPGRVKPGTKIDSISGAIDLLPTLAELAGVPIVSTKPLDGVSLASQLLGRTSTESPDRLIFSHWTGNVSVRSQRFRRDSSGHLYDMTRDPGQARDVSSEHPDVAARLASAAADWSRELLPDLKKDDRPFPVGYREFPITWLPARDGVPHGKIRRSANAPNCSYFTNWTSAEDSITWDIEVATSGRYEAVAYYTAAPEDVGSTLQLGFNGSQIRAKVVEAHNPPARGAEHDRVKRNGESYVKDFKPMRLGAFDLTKGRGPLTLRAIEIPGRSAIELRTIVLTLVE
ncbi:arylsulfatase [Singulisphaera sp. PoT]|uniref:arylsulfatase n=1 Tax=Singulisphaera sp. PoT TaxID=3411797 RepID=UPI003BF4DA26